MLHHQLGKIMATLLNSVSQMQNPSSEFTRNDFRFPDFPLKLSFRFSRKGFSRVLATTQINTSPNDNNVFTVPDWKSGNIDKNTRIDRLYEALFHLESLVGKGYTPDPKYSAELIFDLCRVDKILKASRVLKLMVESGLVPQAEIFSCLIGNFLKRLNFGRALQLVEQMEGYGHPVDLVACHFIIRRLCRNGNLYHALKVVDKLLAICKPPDASAHKMVLGAAYKKYGADGAIRISDYIIDGGGKPNTDCYNILVHGLCKEGRIDEAVKLFRSLPTKGSNPNKRTYNVIFGGLCSEERWDEAKNILAEMIDDPNLTWDAKSTSLINSVSLHGKIDQVLELMEEMYTDDVDMALFNPVIERLAKEKRVDDIIKCLDLMLDRNCEPNPITYNAIAVLCGEGMVKEAFSMLKSFGEKVHSVENCDYYTTAIKYISAYGNTYEALQLLDEMVDSGYTPNSYTYSWLITRFCSEQRWKEAIEIFRILGESGIRWNMKNYCVIVIGFCNCWKIDLAFEVYEYMIENRCMPVERIYISLVDGIMLEDKLLAFDVLKELRSKRVLNQSAVDNIVLDYDLIDDWKNTTESQIEDDE